MSDWIPLIQSLIWPTFLAVLLLYGRAQVKIIMEQIAARIKAGAFLQVGPGGISLGQTENKLTRLEDTAQALDPVAPDDIEVRQQMPVYPHDHSAVGIVVDGGLPGDEKVTCLVHAVSAPQIDTDGVERRAVRAIVDADSPEILNEIERVVYHLHPTFPDPDREVTDRHNNFELATRAWGEFNLWADVYFRNHKNR